MVSVDLLLRGACAGRTFGVLPVAEDFLRVGRQLGEILLRARQVPRLESLAERLEVVLDAIKRACRGLSVGGLADGAVALQKLLQVAEGLLGGCQIPRLECRAQRLYVFTDLFADSPGLISARGGRGLEALD